MTDLQRFKEMYLSFGITLQEIPDTDNLGGSIISMEAKEHPKFVGYTHFCSWVHFDTQGTFIKQGFWE